MIHECERSQHYDHYLFWLFNELVDGFPLTLDVHYSKITDWTVRIVKRGCADDYPEEDCCGGDVIIAVSQRPDYQEACRNALFDLALWTYRNERNRLPKNYLNDEGFKSFADRFANHYICRHFDDAY